MGGLVFDWTRGLEQSVEHTTAFMGTFKYLCHDVEPLPSAEMFSLVQRRSWWLVQSRCKGVKRNILYQTNDTYTYIAERNWGHVLRL